MSTTIDEITKRTIRLDGRVYEVIVRDSILGFTKEIDECVYVLTKNRSLYPQFSSIRLYDGFSGIIIPVIYENNKNRLFFSNKHGYYMFKDEFSPEQIIIETYTKYPKGGDSRLSFPYHFSRTYEAINHFDIFKGKQRILDKNKEVRSKLETLMDYTFGLEFETSAGMIPERTCFRDGLIPLRDGSITGFEYSTVVMNTKKGGLQLLKQQIDTLKEYTIFNKECSLHVHLGGYPLNAEKIYALYVSCYKLQNEIGSLVPDLTFHSSHYKNSGKDYCKYLPEFYNFNNLYEGLVGRRYLGSLEQPHPNDPFRDRKWNISTRYYYVNFINMLCYNVNKTVEFRLLRPTYNFNKIKLWLYIFNAILKFSDANSSDICEGNIRFNLESVIQSVYPDDVAERVLIGIRKLGVLKEVQIVNGDKCGQDLMIEDQLFN